MNTAPDPVAFDLSGTPLPAPDFERIEAALVRSEAIVVGLAGRFPKNAVFADHLASTRRGLALVARARAARAMGDQARFAAATAELAAVFTGQGKAHRLAEWGLAPK